MGIGELLARVAIRITISCGAGRAAMLHALASKMMSTPLTPIPQQLPESAVGYCLHENESLPFLAVLSRRSLRMFSTC